MPIIRGEYRHFDKNNSQCATEKMEKQHFQSGHLLARQYIMRRDGETGRNLQLPRGSRVQDSHAHVQVLTGIDKFRVAHQACIYAQRNCQSTGARQFSLR